MDPGKIRSFTLGGVVVMRGPTDEDLERIRRRFAEKHGEDAVQPGEVVRTTPDAPRSNFTGRFRRNQKTRTFGTRSSTADQDRTSDEELLWLAVRPDQGTRESRAMAQHRLIEVAQERNDPMFWERVGRFLLDSMEVHDDVGHGVSDHFAESCPDLPFGRLAEQSIRCCRFKVWRRRAEDFLRGKDK
jgi:hypothetical protein